MALSREDILNADDRVTEEVDVPQWGGKVTVKALTGKERDAYEASCVTVRGKETIPNMTNIRAKLVARSVVDDDGERIFSDSDINALGAKSAAALDRLFDVASRLSGLSQEDVDKLAANLEQDPSDDSTSS